MAKVRAGLIEAKKLVVDGVDVGKKLIELSDKVESQQKQIESLQEKDKKIEELSAKVEDLQKQIDALKK